MGSDGPNDFELQMIAGLARIEERLAPMKDHERRITALERWNYRVVAAVGVMGLFTAKVTGSIDPLLSAFHALFGKG
jgi:hypothetical protein